MPANRTDDNCFLWVTPPPVIQILQIISFLTVWDALMPLASAVVFSSETRSEVPHQQPARIEKRRVPGSGGRRVGRHCPTVRSRPEYGVAFL